LITKAIAIGIFQLCSVTSDFNECTDWMLECVNIESGENPYYAEDNLLEVCIESYEGDFFESTP
jgi:hypothetical protein